MRDACRAHIERVVAMVESGGDLVFETDDVDLDRPGQSYAISIGFEMVSADRT